MVLVTVALLSLAALTLGDLMLAEREGAHISNRMAQARALAASGVEAVRLFVSMDEEWQNDNGGWFNNPAWFSGMVVHQTADPLDTGLFSVIAPDWEDTMGTTIRYGLENESAKLNVNSLLLADQYAENGGRQLLMGLPGMTEDIADAIMDWLDADDEPREFGAEIEYYSGLSPAYATKNGPLETIEELLLVRGVTPELLFGADRNRNGIIDADETIPEAFAGLSADDPVAYRGWSAYLTLYSMELNVRPDGRAKININQDDLEALYNQLEEEFGHDVATFIVGYRQNGPYEGTEQSEPMPADAQIDFSRPSRVKFSTVLDLIGAKVRMQFAGENEPRVIDPVFPNDPALLRTILPLIMANLTATSSKVIPGRININLAPRSILYGIPTLDPSVAEMIIQARPKDPTLIDDENYRYETWILADGLVTLDEMKALMPFITCGGNVYRAQVVGYFAGGGPSCRVEAIVDATVRPARLLFWRDMSHLGRGFPLDVLGSSGQMAGLGRAGTVVSP
ncbi:putative general secretion pathway protein K [Thermogutta terrifontis]|uniref:Putative general secretion pathway protein K n=1 Tax=Thermogutta terrifontis TaxID=1331910 RepID=A0A286RIH9_9BACT|nr:putative general secretion pathway protein K [Thermogutta terrifontis]